jgi:hypothetical protein
MIDMVFYCPSLVPLACFALQPVQRVCCGKALLLGLSAVSAKAKRAAASQQ